MKPANLLQWLSLVIALCGGVLAMADTITPITAINPTVAHLWPIVLVTATIISRSAAIISEWIKKNYPIVILLFATLQITGCDSKTLSDAYHGFTKSTDVSVSASYGGVTVSDTLTGGRRQVGVNADGKEIQHFINR